MTPATHACDETDRAQRQRVQRKQRPLPSSSGRVNPATAHATATGSRLRGRSSNSSSSTASSTAATGVPNTAVMPATAPATSSVLRSAALRWKYCAISEPIAPPVMMIGPSAPNGPPLPMAIAEDERLEHRHLGRHLALAEQDRFDRFGNAVATNLLGAVARDQADDQDAAEHRNHDDESPSVFSDGE